MKLIALLLLQAAVCLWLRWLDEYTSAFENTSLKDTVRSARLSRMSQPTTPPPTREQCTPSSSSHPPSEAEEGHDLKLHIGGEQVKRGWKILNAQPKPGADFVGNICDLSQFADASVSAIYASHVLEHVPQALVPATLAGIHRVLKKGGAFMVSVPDMEVLCRLFTHPGGTMDNRMHIMRMMFGGQTDAFDFHYFGWSWEFMQQCPPPPPPSPSHNLPQCKYISPSSGT
jgi:predicted SAM-dependent methyltransferase